MMFGWSVSGGDQLEVADNGAWTALVTSGEGTAGRCGDRLAHRRLDQLRKQVEAAVAAGPPDRDPDTPWTAGSSVETIWAADTVGQQEWGTVWPSEWAPLAAAASTILEDATTHPIACLRLDATDDGNVRHAGTQPLVTDGSDLTVHAHESAADGAIGSSFDTTLSVPDGGTIPVGWAAALELGSANLSTPAGGTIEISVGCVLADPPLAITAWASIPEGGVR